MDMDQVELYAKKSDIDNNLSDPTVIAKYRLAADIATDALTKVVEKAASGVLVSELCAFGDEIILSYTSKVYNKNNVEKGIAFPTMISVNNCVEYYSPTGEGNDELVLKDGDVVKIELGAHIDGYIATNAHTLVINPNPSQPVQGRAADVVCAAYYAAEAALRLMKVGNSNVQVQEAIAEAAALFNCSPVEGTASNEIKRYVIATEKLILNVPDDDNRPVQNFTFSPNEAYTLNILISSATRDGSCKEGISRPTVFARNVHQNYNLKLKSARAAFTQIQNQFSVFPFSVRALEDKRHRLGVTELASHQLLTSYPVYYTRPSEVVAQFKMTVLISTTGVTRITPSLTLPYVHSTYTIPQDSHIAQLMSENVKTVKSGKSLTGIEAGQIEAPAQGMDVDM